MLTETKATAGSMFLAEAFTAAGYSVTFPEHAHGELGVMIVSKLATTLDSRRLVHQPARPHPDRFGPADHHAVVQRPVRRTGLRREADVLRPHSPARQLRGTR
ncbi:hypothetical protein [Lentzea kentuckyensis]|uniref:hypothetical protein n=1 Tax=Lentzea kentuckyensis TaxID=360086 RepID=UPI001FE3E64A|nr:hypothetical protein [Lentzea kentuckyensis]